MNSQVLIDRKILEQALRNEGLKPRLNDYCCSGCGNWMPYGHPEAHEHEPGCREEAEAINNHWRMKIRTALATPAPIPDAAEGVDGLEKFSPVLRGANAVMERVHAGGYVRTKDAKLLVSALRDGGGVERWIPVGERLPEPNQGVAMTSYWCWGTYEDQYAKCGFEGIYLGGKWYCLNVWGDDADAQVTHWMPLPAPPLSKLETTTQERVGE